MKIFLFALGGMLGALVQASPAKAPSASEPDDALQARRPAFQQQLSEIDRARRTFQVDLAQREAHCLKKFFSARCMDQIRQEHLEQMRQFDLRREEALQGLRDIDAILRDRARQKRIAERGQS
jgi:hypothetical protein